MDLTIYTYGKGLDVSKDKSLPLMSRLSKHIYIEPSNLYNLRGFAEFESLDFIYSKNLINNTKFYRVLLQEWFNYCNVGGYIIIEFTQNRLLGQIGLLKEIKIIFSKKARIIEDYYDKDDAVIVIKKISPALVCKDKIDKWSFGIITGGKRDDWVDMEIESIKRLKIPHYEIIVCGGYKKRKGIVHIPFGDNEGIGLGKNKICKRAKYENIAISHDKFIYDPYWFQGMKRYGNYFQVLGCIIHDSFGNRAGDWITYGNSWYSLPRIGLLEYDDWDKHIYLDGGFYIIKRSVWEIVKWNEKIVWGQAEDIALSREWYPNGIIPRFNPFSSLITLKWNHGRLREYLFNSLRLGKLKSGSVGLFIYYIKQIIKKQINHIKHKS